MLWDVDVGEDQHGELRYGFNGKENDNEVKGTGNEIDYGMRVPDPRAGRFMSVDPLTRKYPWYTPYQFAGNTPIWASDVDGMEPDYKGSGEGQTGETKTEHYAPTGVGIGSTYITNDTWYWHSGGILKRFETPQHQATYTRSGWYNEETYRQILQLGGESGYAGQLAGYLNLFNERGGHNWSPQEKANVANTSLANFARGLSEGATAELIASAHEYANNRNLFVVGITELSPINVEDFLGAAALLKGGLERAAGKIIGSAQTTGTFGHAFTSSLIAWRYALNPNVERVTLDLGYKKLLGGGSFKWGPRPDVGILFKNGDVKVFEIMSKTDVESRLFNKNVFFQKRFSIEAETIVTKPFSLKAFQ